MTPSGTEYISQFYLHELTAWQNKRVNKFLTNDPWGWPQVTKAVIVMAFCSIVKSSG